MYQMMIGTYTKRGSEGIYLLEMDDILQQVRVISVIGEKNPSYLCLDSEKKCLYAALENEVGEVAVYNVENRKAPKFMGKYETGGSTTCHVSLSVASSSTKAPEQLVRRRLRQSGSIISSSSAFSTSGESFSWSKVISRLASCRSTRAPI